jgi:hypothetical protein
MRLRLELVDHHGPAFDEVRTVVSKNTEFGDRQSGLQPGSIVTFAGMDWGRSSAMRRSMLSFKITRISQSSWSIPSSELSFTVLAISSNSL